jgi:hypothetical protein
MRKNAPDISIDVVPAEMKIGMAELQNVVSLKDAFPRDIYCNLFCWAVNLIVPRHQNE